MLSAIGRIIWVPIALFISTIVCAAVIVSLGMERLTGYYNGLNDPDMNMQGGFELLESALLLAQALTILPALAIVIIGEVARIRSVYYYVVCGGLAAVSAPLIARIGLDGPFVVPAIPIWQVFATGGFIAGFVYWLLAGRKA